MPLFKSRAESPEPVSPTRKGSIFNRRRSVSPQRSEASAHTSPSARRGFFGGGRNSSSDESLRHGSTRTAGSGSGGLFNFGNNGHDIHGDPSILAARQKVTDAEEAERAADRALNAARSSVREAKEHVRFLEREAKEEALRAKAKQAEAKVVSKTARNLGRHGQ